MNRISISNKEIIELLHLEAEELPKYTSQILNLANQNAQGTRPKVVGNLSELIQIFPGKSGAEWKEWYLKQQPQAIEDAVRRIAIMIDNLKEAIVKIDEPLIRKWVEELVFCKNSLIVLQGV